MTAQSLEKYRVIAAMLTLDTFTVQDLADISGAIYNTARTNCDRLKKKGFIETVNHQHEPQKGRPRNHMRIVPEQRAVLEAEYNQARNVFMAQQATTAPETDLPLGLIATEGTLDALEKRAGMKQFDATYSELLNRGFEELQVGIAEAADIPEHQAQIKTLRMQLATAEALQDNESPTPEESLSSLGESKPAVKREFLKDMTTAHMWVEDIDNRGSLPPGAQARVARRLGRNRNRSESEEVAHILLNEITRVTSLAEKYALYAKAKALWAAQDAPQDSQPSLARLIRAIFLFHQAELSVSIGMQLSQPVVASLQQTAAQVFTDIQQFAAAQRNMDYLVNFAKLVGNEQGLSPESALKIQLLNLDPNDDEMTERVRVTLEKPHLVPSFSVTPCSLESVQECADPQNPVVMTLLQSLGTKPIRHTLVSLRHLYSNVLVISDVYDEAQNLAVIQGNGRYITINEFENTFEDRSKINGLLGLDNETIESIAELMQVKLTV